MWIFDFLVIWITLSYCCEFTYDDKTILSPYAVFLDKFIKFPKKLITFLFEKFKEIG